VLPFEVDLLVREAQAREPGGGVRLVAQAVARLLGGGAVVAQTVALDNQPQLRPVEVHLEAVHDLPGERQRQPGRDGERDQIALEL
jgi:hypothetical protein